ncbi:hypothetical protein EC9_03700 [Rosistilla ulvae]|uniref:SMODS and SLOG-associating 2TM effector domain-containing protein n=1 Tax=Rosistilla ulvae TaxID=1930277 RepID=A0A517LUB0_9BACT|nr:SLATT domain-containing protein [Rosistilla ulvae]QDS86210.1 hypothetical protein EC9_03700 [Rosistilla ulvae]
MEDKQPKGNTNVTEAVVSASDDSVEEKYRRLYEKMDKTARSRFIASRRFELQETLSLYTVVLMSCAVIGLTLLDGLEMLAPEAAKASAFLQVFAAIGVLVYSVILSKSDFALHAYRHHECGIAINHLRNSVFKHMVDMPKADKFNNLSDSYNTILERFENHLNLDFEIMLVRSKHYHKFYDVGFCFKSWVCVKAFLVYWHYLFFMLLSVAGLAWIGLAFDG